MTKSDKKEVVRGDSRLAIKVGFWYTFTTFLTRGIAFITTPVFSRLMTKADYGEFSNYANWMATLLILVGAELYSTLSRAYYDYKDEYDGYISSVTITNCILTCILYILFLFSGGWIYKFVSIPPQFVHIMFFTMMCMSCRSVFLARERTLYRYKSVAIISVVGTLIPTIISVITVYFSETQFQLASRIYGFYIPSSIVGLTCAIILVTKGKTFSFAHIKYALKLSVPLLSNYLTIYLLTSSNVIITKSVLGADDAATVSMATSVIHILTTLLVALSGAVTTWIMDNLEQKNYIKLRKEILVYIVGIAILTIGVVLFTPEIVFLMGGKAYYGAIELIPFLSLSVFIQSVMTVFTIVLTYEKKIKITGIAAAVVAVLSVLAKIWILPMTSLQSLSIVNAASFAILFIVNYILVVRVGYSEIINLKRFLMVIAFVLIVCIASFMLYKSSFIRFLIIIAFALSFMVLAIKNKDIVLKFVKSGKSKKQN